MLVLGFSGFNALVDFSWPFGTEIPKYEFLDLLGGSLDGLFYSNYLEFLSWVVPLSLSLSSFPLIGKATFKSAGLASSVQFSPPPPQASALVMKRCWKSLEHASWKCGKTLWKTNFNAPKFSIPDVRPAFI